jgi:ADP-ribose pyrophosphatase YjhB (NUDIX family)
MNSPQRRPVGQFAWSAMMAARALLAPVAFGANAMLVDQGGKVLLARHTYVRGLGFPGGGVNRGEPAQHAVMRELNEELGTFRADPPVFVGLFTRRSGWATNVIALYRLMNAQVDFRPNAEIREVVFVDPADPPADTMPGVRRRLAEYVSQSPPSPYW